MRFSPFVLRATAPLVDAQQLLEPRELRFICQETRQVVGVAADSDLAPRSRRPRARCGDRDTAEELIRGHQRCESLEHEQVQEWRQATPLMEAVGRLERVREVPIDLDHDHRAAV